jgi:hypothetical protein
MTTNKRLLISKRYDDSNRCTSCRRNLIHMTRMHSWQAIRGNLSHRRQWNWAGPLLPRNKCSRRNPQPGWVICGFHTVSLLCQLMKQWGQSQASIAVWLHQFTGSITPACDQYIQYFLVGSTHQSLTNTGGCYNLGGASFPHHTPRPSQPTVLHFSPKGPARS